MSARKFAVSFPWTEVTNARNFACHFDAHSSAKLCGIPDGAELELELELEEAELEGAEEAEDGVPSRLCAIPNAVCFGWPCGFTFQDEGWGAELEGAEEAEDGRFMGFWGPAGFTALDRVFAVAEEELEGVEVEGVEGVPCSPTASSRSSKAASNSRTSTSRRSSRGGRAEVAAFTSAINMSK